VKRLNYPRWVALGIVCVAGCASPIDAPSAYEGQQYLCDEAHAASWDARVEACRSAHAVDGSCAAAVSFRGNIDHHDVVGSMQADVGTFIGDVDSSGVPIRMLHVAGPTPYFRLAITYGFFLRGQPGRPAGNISNMNLEARGGNYLVGLIEKEHAILVDTDEEFAFSVASNLSRGGSFDGCLHLFLSPTQP
jgi:hypothetical protein